ncbi:MAG: hypothetical protein R8G60_09800 [Roseovarius pacificus]|nr:hypothetical protein [Roseovarius pacificus]
MTDKQPVLQEIRGEQESYMGRPAQRSGVQVRERNGIWKVTANGRFHGDYHQKEHALAAAALVRLTTR